MAIRKFIMLCFILNTSYFYGQFCTNNDRFTEETYFSTDQVTTSLDITYGNAIGWQGNNINLKFDVFAPSQEIDNLPERPVIIVMHGGGFQNGTKTSWHEESFSLAQRGYVVISISYRLGWDINEPAQQLVAAYRANQDVRAALRYIVENADDYAIDSNWIFLGGKSAGAVNSLNTVYFSQEEWNDLIPNIENSLGNVNTSGNALTNKYQIKGVFNNWGATFKSYMQVDEMIPMVSFHGALDNTLPIDDNGPFNFSGSRAIHNKLIENKICSDLTVDPIGTHGVYTDSEGKIFKLSKASCFFKSIFCESCETQYSEEPIEATCSKTLSFNTLDNARIKVSITENPFTSYLRLTPSNGDYVYSLNDIFGTIIFKGKHLEHQNFSYLASGIYFLVISKSNTKQVIKLIKK